MKGSGARSNRGSTDAADDWVNGGWTVDCICGVTFDDGEEMVDCDLCGVWVHTRCSRYVKGDKSFACDNCKAHTRTRTTRATRTTTLTDPEETEVAQLLVDLPTKTIHHHTPTPTPTPTPHRIRPYRLWAERPLHDRVHVQGVPGGDPHLFQSTAFPLLVNSQLWKSSGYIPKHFNFPCSQPDYHNPPHTSQPPILDPSPTALKPPPPPPDECAHHKPTPLLHLTSKRFREDSKDRSAKKKIKAFHTDHPNHETKRDKSHALNTVTNASIATALSPVIESKTHKVVSNAQLPTASNIEKSKRNAATEDCKLAPRSPEDFAPATSVDKPALDPPSQLHSSVRTTLKSFPSPDGDVTVPTIAKKEGVVVAIDEIQAARAQSPTVTIDKPKSKPLIGELTNAAAKRKNTATLRNLEAIAPLGTGPCSSETRSDAHLDNPKGVLTSNLAGININTDSIKNPSEHVLSPDQECKGSNLCEGVTSTSKPLDEKDNGNGLEAAGGCQFDRNDEITDVQCSEKLDCEGSKGTLEVQKFPCDSKVVPQLSAVVPPASPPPPSSHHKNSSVGKASSTSAIVFSRSYIADRSRSGVSQNASLVGKQQLSNSCVNTKKEHAPVDLAKDEDKHDKPTSTLKDDPEPCSNSTLKSSQPSRTVLKYYASVGKDSLRHSSSKVSSVDSSSVSSSVNEPAVDLQSEHVLHEHNKNITSGGQQRCDKVPQSNLQPSSKLSQSSTGHPTASSKSPAGLSDEELALLLHQELNSSPRVPRVPRVRHAGSLPHLSSTTAANMLMKRTSTSGGKDKNMCSRRKSRDALKDGIHSSREQDSEVGKVDRVPSPDSLKKSGVFNPAVAEVDTDSKAKQNLEKISSSAASNGPISVNAVKLKSSSTRVNSPEDKAEANKNSDRTYRTLPGLIAEIMGKGRRMTYEELCNAVLPHWPNLRKHNGERYAYSSHSQAVLDCLRNRTEWARLVDRGPKTSSSRKKRKIDAEPLSSESEDREDRNVKDGGESKSSESNKEDFPKGRRKARKGKRVASQGKSVKDGQKRRKVEVGSSCDSESFSNSSEDSLSSQDDSQGSEMDVANTEVSASSQSIRATS